MTTHCSKASDTDAPWNHDNPRAAQGKPRNHLTPAQKASAKRHAKAAGRPYPNLVDNMQAARKGKAT
ncbi:hypothetical protein [Pseudorhodoferax sp.]|uniref:hypothetical protein n=1 Tax=Pseudorhodoferax sp. TaxID=1993553 RepID=UPI002DD6A995|nr:hypothetical protein [Pseudorhodoferax sp.]